MGPLISVIIPTYNHAEFIAEAVSSVLVQTYNNIEVIVVDNFSTDETISILTGLSTDDRLKYFKFENKGIIAAARNYGVQQASGEYIAFLDSDDIWVPKKLEKQMAVFDRGLSAVCSNFIPMGDVRFVYNQLSKVIEKSKYKDFGYEQVILQNPVITSSVLIRAEDFIAVGGFNESSDFAYIEDWELWLRLCSNGYFRALFEPLLHYRLLDKPERDLRDVARRTLLVINSQKCHGLKQSILLAKARSNCFAYLGKVHLAVNDYWGILYYLRSLVGISSWLAKKRAVFGLGMFIIPRTARLKVSAWVRGALL
ncbi:MAG: glycosyltransferase [Gammaproteobacteria bacterium]|nr:glycosyltransferase [Gammaproteobacteria bacterium]